MKNKLILNIIILTFFLLKISIAYSEEFKFETDKIDIVENGQKYKAENGKIITNDNLTEIFGDYLEYDRKNLILMVEGNVKIFDLLNNTKINAKKIIYYKKEEKIITLGETLIETDNNFLIKTKNLTYLKKETKIKSNEFTSINDKLGNVLTVSNFVYLIPDKIINGSSINYSDLQSNKYFIEQGVYDLNSRKVIGKDLEINFDRSSFGNSTNQPRLKGRSIYVDENVSIIKKGVFTTCKKRDKCPPWTLSANEVVHDKNKKIINYKKAWLKVYNKPVLYFPKFFHPDPTVKRQSGFLMPIFSDSNKLGLSLEVPYYHVISDNKDLTFKPRFFNKNDLILQSEYRQVNKNSKHILDFSINRKQNLLDFDKDKSLKTHYFSNSIFDLDIARFEESNMKINLQHSSNDTYLKTYKLKSPIINSTSTLNSYVSFDLYNEDLMIETNFEVYEDLNNTTSDRYEYVYPNFNIVKNLNINPNYDGELQLKAYGYQKTYDGDVHDVVYINDLLFNSYSELFKSGLKNKYSLLLKNVNTDAENSLKYKNHSNSEILGTALFEMKYPLNKLGEKYDTYLTPIVSMRYSPTHTRNMKNENRRIDINNIYALNRIGKNDTIEGGYSITIGNEFSKKNKDRENIVSLDLATSFRNEENKDLPIKSTIGNKTSDIIGNLKINPTKNLDIDYNFSLDNDLNRSNFDEVKATLSINNFVTSFEFLETKNYIGSEGYITNNTQYSFNESNNLKFSTRKNKKTDLVEFYNLIYQYKNDCLVAALEYNKSYYNDNDLQPEEQLFFSISIIPFGKAVGPNLNR